MGLALDESRETDKTFEFDQLKIVVEEDLLNKAGTIKLDYSRNMMGGGFRLDAANPLWDGGGSNNCGSCSC